MNFAFDYDGCITNAPREFYNFAFDLFHHGHKIYIVTMRYPSECTDIPEEWNKVVEAIVPTSRMAKKPHMDAKGINIHVWIDDNPNAVYLNADQIWGTPSPEGQVVDVQHDK